MGGDAEEEEGKRWVRKRRGKGWTRERELR